MKIKYFLKTDIGVKRQENQDNAAVFKNKNNELMALICDGMGGYAGGYTASNVTMNKMINSFQKQNFSNMSYDNLSKWIKKNIKNVKDELSLIAEQNKILNQMGTTLVLALFLKNYIAIINVGDSRAYTVSQDNKLTQITKDQNLASDIQKKWDISYEEAINFPEATLLTSVVGVDKITNVDIYFLKNNTFKYLILTSDGIHDYLSNREMENILNNQKTLETKTNKLIQRALIEESTDNLTSIIVKVIQ